MADVLYQGLVLCTDVAVQKEPDGLFVEMPAPMPVGTTLGIRQEGELKQGRVLRVHESIGAGVLVRFDGAAAATATTAAPDDAGEDGPEGEGDGDGDGAPEAGKAKDGAAPPRRNRRRRR
jgi:hypothetical protein